MTQNGWQYYRSGGLLIESSLPLDELAPPAEAGPADLRVAAATAEEIAAFESGAEHVLSVGGDGEPWLSIHRNADTYMARWPGQMDVVMRDDGSSMRVYQAGAVDDSIPRLLLCQSLSFILPAHDREGLHASAVEIDGKAVVIAGEPGRGKSTLATALCLAGGRLLADDLAVIRIVDGKPVVEPGSTKTWLLNDVAKHLFGAVEQDSPPRAHKVAVGGNGIAHASEAYPLAAMYLLRYGDATPVVSEPLAGSNAVIHFLAALFNMVVASPKRLAVQFRVSTEVVAHSVLRTVRWQPGPEAARLLAERIIAEAQRSNGNGGQMDVTIPANGLGAPVVSNGRSVKADHRREILALLRDAGIAGDVEDGMDEPLLRTSQVAALLRSSDRTVRSWADAGKLKYVKTLGGRRLFPASAVLAALKQMSAGTHEEA